MALAMGALCYYILALVDVDLVSHPAFAPQVREWQIAGPAGSCADGARTWLLRRVAQCDLGGRKPNRSGSRQQGGCGCIHVTIYQQQGMCACVMFM